MAVTSNDGRVPVLNLADALGLYYDLLEQSKDLDRQVRTLRDRIVHTMSSRRIEQVVVDGLEAERQLRHHAPHLNEERATEILREHGRLEECQVERLDEDRARSAIDELFRHGALSKDDLPYVYVKPTEALVVRQTQAVPQAEKETRRAA